MPTPEHQRWTQDRVARELEAWFATRCFDDWPPYSAFVADRRKRLTVALDVHKRFAEVAVHEDGALRRLGRIETAQLRVFAQSLGPQDHVVLESTAVTWAIAELLAEHAGRVTVSNPMRTRAMASAKVKTDKIDAKVLAQLGAADFLPEVSAPDELTRALRRRIAHRSSVAVPERAWTATQRPRAPKLVHSALLWAVWSQGAITRAPK